MTQFELKFIFMDIRLFLASFVEKKLSFEYTLYAHGNHPVYHKSIS